MVVKNSPPAASQLRRIGEILAWTQNYLTQAGVQNARLDAELLMAHALKVDRVYLYIHEQRPLNEEERQTYKQLILRRRAREPVAYILGEKEFYGRSFQVDKRVLIPRSETELLVDKALALFPVEQKTPACICDVGCGSGILAITLALSYPNAVVWALDSSVEALVLAAINAQHHGLQHLRMHPSHLLEALSLETLGSIDLLVANLPYIALSEKSQLMPEVAQYEPAMALFAQEEGLALIKQLSLQAFSALAPQGIMLLEIGYRQQAPLEAFFQQHLPGFAVHFENDLQQHPRMLVAQKGY